MGLTIHYSLRVATATARRVHAMVRKLHRAASTMPFDDVSDILEYPVRGGSLADQPGWFGFVIELMAREFGRRLVPPRRVFAFRVLPGPECEPAVIGLAQYPTAVTRADGRRIQTKLRGWWWNSFCKTQYASNPRCGGFDNFRRCHVSLVAMLDEAAKIGLRTKVVDESGFAEHRDVEHLAQVVAKWNEMVAGFAGRMKDALPVDFDAPIRQFPDFEHLEARGRDEGR